MERHLESKFGVLVCIAFAQAERGAFALMAFFGRYRWNDRNVDIDRFRIGIELL
jgi:hypothetical protein